MEKQDNFYKPPKKELGDVSHEITGFLLKRIPGIGNVAGDLFDAFFTPPIEKRREEWRETVGEALTVLVNEHNKSLVGLQNNGNFIDSCIRSSQIAIRTSLQNKRIALKNALINSVLASDLSSTKKEMFFHLIDILTSWHLIILSFFDNPLKWYKKHDLHFTERKRGNIKEILFTAFPDLKNDDDLLGQLWQDLATYGLIIRSVDLETTIGNDQLKIKRTSKLGEEFLRFINEPKPE
jgi:hypothetical protein